MADRWLYKHNNAVHGPVEQKKLEQLATIGELLPSDLVWAEGEDPRRGVEALSLLSVEAFGKVLAEVDQGLSTPPTSPGATPDWLKDVQAAPAPTQPPAPSETPDWLANPKNKAAAKPPPAKAAKPQLAVAMPVKPKVAPPVDTDPADVELVEDEEEDAETTFEFRRRDFIMFALGGISVGLAIGIGFFVANRSQRSPKDEETPENKE